MDIVGYEPDMTKYNAYAKTTRELVEGAIMLTAAPGLRGGQAFQAVMAAVQSAQVYATLAVAEATLIAGSAR